jgi:glutamate dehydrogenase/leucine dehydrogenase
MMEDLLKQYKNKAPEIVFEWRDPETGAEGWIVINSLRGGAAGGGTRMRKGLTKDEVVSLAKVMEIKFSVCGPDIGGAKSGINFDPQHPDRRKVLERWYKAAMPLLKYYYGTGGDLNVDEIKDVAPITESYGLWHPQEGIVQGHLSPGEGSKVQTLIQLREGVGLSVKNPMLTPDPTGHTQAVADLITGYGVAESVRHYYHFAQASTASGKKAVIQGWGNVASAAAFYLAQQGVHIVGIIDRSGGLIAPEGLGPEHIREYFLHKKGNALDAPDMLPFDTVNAQIWDLGADIFIPGAASRLITRNQIDRLLNGGIEVIACGANVPFEDDDVFFGPTAHYTDRQTALIPDFIANCGMARVFAYLMQPGAALTDTAIFEDCSATIGRAMEDLIKNNQNARNLSQNALYLALKKLDN